MTKCFNLHSIERLQNAWFRVSSILHTRFLKYLIASYRKASGLLQFLNWTEQVKSVTSNLVSSKIFYELSHFDTQNTFILLIMKNQRQGQLTKLAKHNFAGHDLPF